MNHTIIRVLVLTNAGHQSAVLIFSYSNLIFPVCLITAAASLAHLSPLSQYNDKRKCNENGIKLVAQRTHIDTGKEIPVKKPIVHDIELATSVCH
jgi:hypothetical protein